MDIIKDALIKKINIKTIINYGTAGSTTGITGLVDNYLMDCLGICNGDAVIDSCDFCNGNIFVLEDCPQP